MCPRPTDLMGRQIGKCEPALPIGHNASFCLIRARCRGRLRTVSPLSEQVWVLDVGRAAGGRSGNWVAACRFAAGHLHDVGAEARVGDLVVGAHELRAAARARPARIVVLLVRACTVSASARVRTSMLAASAALIARRVGDRIVELGERGIRRHRATTARTGSARATTDGRRARSSASLSLSSMKMTPAAHGAERRPAARADRVTEARVVAANVVGGDEVGGREHRADLGLERVERRRRSRRRPSSRPRSSSARGRGARRTTS